MKVVLYFQSPSKTSAAMKQAGAADVAARCGWTLQVIDRYPTPHQLQELLDFWQPVGALVDCGGGFDGADRMDFGKTPVVFIDRCCEKPRCTSFSVCHDSEATTRMAARALMNTGYRNFAFVHPSAPRFWSEERENAFARLLSLSGYAASVFRPATQPIADQTGMIYQRELRAFLESLPRQTAIFAANDVTARQVVVAAQAIGRAVPEFFAVIGVDNAVDVCCQSEPYVSSVAPDFRRGGELAVLMLKAVLRAKDGYVGPRKRTFGPSKVVHRTSTRVLAVTDAVVMQACQLIAREACIGLTALRVTKLFPCSRVYAEIRFRRATGKSILQAIHEVRLERAKELLENPNQIIKSISDFCGFKNPNSLRKFFQKETGLTMTEWRRRHLARRAAQD